MNGWLLRGLWLAVVVSVGCSSARYDDAYATRVGEYRADAPFSHLNRSVENLEGKLKIRLPKEFVVVPDTVEVDAGNGSKEPKPIDPSRKVPQFLGRVPGYLESFERQVDDNFITIVAGVEPEEETGRVKIREVLLTRVRNAKAFGDGDLAWEKVETLPSIVGGPTTWQRLSLRGSLVCEQLENSVVNRVPVPGLCEIWCSDDEGSDATVILVWWCPNSVASSLEMPISSLAQLVARTASVQDPSGAEEDEAGAGGRKQAGPVATPGL